VRRAAHDAAEDLGNFTTTLQMLPITLLVAGAAAVQLPPAAGDADNAHM